MKASLIPVSVAPLFDEAFREQVERIGGLLAEEAEILPPVRLGQPLPEADAVVLPQLSGEAYRRFADFQAIHRPVIIVTSEFGTVSMWDWEIVHMLRAAGVAVFAPYDLFLTRAVCRALALKRDARQARFVVFQDNPGAGMQADIFKRFYWWEDACLERIRSKFGVTVVKRSMKELCAAAKRIPDADADLALAGWRPPAEKLSPTALRSAAKQYLAVKESLGQDPSIRGVGMNCLNESAFSDTTPCLAWDRLFEERGLMCACEADLLSLLTLYLVRGTLQAPIMMSNLYPFLVGQAALKHEKIAGFPVVADPENHLLVAHCGYFGLLPRAMATEWTLRPKVLDIVDANAHMMDARLPEGPVTLVKIDPSLNRLQVMEGVLTQYAQFPGSHCRNGGVIRVADGRRLMDVFYSHHYGIMPGHQRAGLEILARILDLEIDNPC